MVLSNIGRPRFSILSLVFTIISRQNTNCKVKKKKNYQLCKSNLPLEVEKPTIIEMIEARILHKKVLTENNKKKTKTEMMRKQLSSA